MVKKEKNRLKCITASVYRLLNCEREENEKNVLLYMPGDELIETKGKSKKRSELQLLSTKQSENRLN